MKTIWKIIIGIPSAAAAIAIIGGLYLYFDSIRNKPLTKIEVTEIVNTGIKTNVDPLRDEILFQWTMLDDQNSNLNLLKNAWLLHVRKDSSNTKMNEIIYTLNEWRNDLKKNWNPTLLKPK
jgi:hypothetical protein